MTMEPQTVEFILHSQPEPITGNTVPDPDATMPPLISITEEDIDKIAEVDPRLLGITEEE